ncbi:uncharacterized protein [Nicotiana sylvestris]|uniref:uncharacterized protein n=1 Tax=Nicotiana sylvestris TaxID=4096 RepID=UPI00388C97E3
MLVLPMGSGSYTVYCDALHIGLGTMLMHNGSVIDYASQQLKAHEKNYHVHDLELAAIVRALKIWRHCLYDIPCELQGWICVPNIDALRGLILEEAHSLRYSIHSGVTKMYRDLKKYYWWRRMKKDIVAYVSHCLNFQRVKYKHKKPGGLT